MIAYLAIFHLWMVLPPVGVLASGIAVVLLLAAGMFAVGKRGYFRDRWDLFIHASIVLDILLEGVLIPIHDDFGFYLCATAFAAVLWGYRAWLGRRSVSAPEGEATTEPVAQ